MEDEDHFLIDEQKGIITILVKADKGYSEIKEIEIPLDKVSEEKKRMEVFEEKIEETKKPRMKDEIQ